MKLEPGQISEPVPRGDAVIVILKLLSRQESRYQAVRRGREAGDPGDAPGRDFDHAKRKWIDELKIRTHVDVRL